MMTSFPIRKIRQSGVALVTGLIFMVVLTIIVISALRSATLEERMAANARNRQVALQAAEAAGREAGDMIMESMTEPFLNYKGSAFTSAGAGSYYNEPVAGEDPRWKSGATWKNASADLYGVPAGKGPTYFVERMGIPGGGTMGPTSGGCPKVLFRVTSRGEGQDGSEVFVQTMYRVQPLSCS